MARAFQHLPIHAHFLAAGACGVLFAALVCSALRPVWIVTCATAGGYCESPRNAMIQPGSRVFQSKTGCDVQVLRHRIGDAARLMRTVRHLRTGQVINRITRQFWHPLPPDRPAPDLRLAKSLWRNCPGRGHAMLSPTRFRFIGQEAGVTTVE